MKIRTRILWTLLGMISLIALVGALARRGGEGIHAALS